MSRVVVDASVVVKWVLPTRADEAETDKALDLLQHVKRGRITLLRYYEKASMYGAICLLRDFAP